MTKPQEGAPKDAPPTYAVATGSSTTSTQPKSSRLEVPGSRDTIPAAMRRSMEDETRPLPIGWVRQWDAKEQHQFFVDTKATPPRSIWHHPYDDEQYLSGLTSEQRERIQQDELDMRKARHYESTDDEGASSSSHRYNDPPLPPRPDSKSTSTSGKKDPLGRRLKDKLTGSTHEERQRERVQREEEERQYYEAHMKFRQAMQQAQMTGQPQFFAKDKDGKDIYIEPPSGPGVGAPYGNRGYGYNPYATGPYANPNVRFIRPANPYNRPYGGGYGGGYGMPIAGGLLGGMLLGGLMF